ncbi:MAG: 30S ribosomal protein S15 [Pseudomonadota bacterium]|nr:30S ribosomal protein S15 [Pseudomonadota bacterium]
MTTEATNIDISAYRTHNEDTGSTPVQVSIITQRVRHLTAHFKANPKDNHSRHGLLKMIRRRQRLLKYYKHADRDAYYKLIQSLEIRDKN